MHNTFISSTIGFRSKGPVCYSSNDHHMLSNGVNRTSSCTCCAFPFNGLPLNPSFFFGLRQSTLIHWSVSKRLILGGGHQFFQLSIRDFDRLRYGESYSVKECCQCSCTRRKKRGSEGRIGCMVYEESCRSCDLDSDVDQICYGKSFLLKESCCCSSTMRTRRGKKGRVKCTVWEDKSESCDSGIEEILGLLTEEDGEHYVGVGDRNRRLSAGRSQAERRGISDYRKREKHAESDCERNSKGTFESVIKSREEDYNLSGRREGSLRGGNRLLKKDGSSCSSYYSALSSNEIDDSDVDVHVKHENYRGESLSRDKNEPRRGIKDVSVKQVIRKSKENMDDVVGYREVSTQRDVSMGSTTVVAGSNRHSLNEQNINLTDESIRQRESRIESSNNPSNVMDRKNGAEMAFVSQNHFRGRGDNSMSSTYSVDETREQLSQTGSQIIQQDESKRNSQHFVGMLQIQDSEQASSSYTRVRRREDNFTTSMNLLEGERERERHSQTGQSSGQNESRKSQQFSKILEINDIDIRNTSTSQRHFESTLRNKVDRSFHEADDQNPQTDQQAVLETKLTKVSQDPSNISVISDSQDVFERRMIPEEEISASNASRMSKNHGSNIRPSTSQRLFESNLKNREESSTSLLSSFHEAEDPNHSEQRVVWDPNSNKGSQDLTNISVTSVSDTTIVSGSHKHLDRRISPRGENSASRVDLVPEAREEKPGQASEHAIKQLGSRKESARLTEISNFRKSSANRAPGSQLLSFAQQATEQQMDEQKEYGRSSQVIVIPPPSQIVHRTSQETVHHRKSANKNATADVHSEMQGSGSSILYTEEINPSPPDELVGGIGKGNIDEEQSNIMFQEDALGSANRQEDTSAQFLRQFVKNLSHEVSTSELQKEKPSLQTSLNKDLGYPEQSSNPQAPESVHPHVDDSGRSSSRSGVRGPSDEIWDVAGPFEELARTEAPSDVPSTTKSSISRRGRSLWSIIGDIVRLRWGTHSETHISTAKSGGKSSSNQSVGTEGWFSSYDADEKDDENLKKGRQGMLKMHGSSDLPSPGKAETQNLRGASEGSSAINGASSSSKEERLNERSGQGIPSTTSISSSSSPLPPRHLMRSPAVKGNIPESNEIVVSRSDFVQMEQPVRESPTEASGAEVKDRELKRRKLQRNKQTEKETFEEWEEAYRLESEQRNIDELYMKEALLEAKMAADTWEVPVGAVLVQNGKIIARGRNLVEDLRDSTAHAEMICIREASKILQTWRLAETTLYVTLEPCAMCAGAILQARIDTVVWGAPNKLLGADGSWVRLFPGGGEAGGSSNLTSQPAGPVHPFHPKISVRRGILATECADVMQQFFQLRRKKNKKPDSPPTSSLHVSAHPTKLISKMHDIFGVMFCL